MNESEGFLTLLGMLIVFGLPVWYAVHNRTLRHKETLAMIEKGLMEAPKHKNGGKDALRWGIIFTAIGLAFLVGLYPLGYTYGEDYLFRFGPWMLIGLLPTFFGVGLIAVYKATQEDDDTKDLK